MVSGTAARKAMLSSPRTRFAALVAAPDADIDLASAALDIAADAYPDLDAARYLARLDEMAGATRAPDGDALEALRAINRVLYDEAGLRGNDGEYYDPRNSYLNEVLDRGLGIPITLAVIYLEVGWRVGLPVEGVSFPGHFLVRCPYREGYLFLDPFHRGAALDTAQLAARVVSVLGERARRSGLLDTCLGPASKRDILSRMLRNLRAVFAERGDDARALDASDRLCVLLPDDVDLLRDRAELYRRLRCYRQAEADYARCLELSPGAPDAVEIRARLEEVSGREPRLH